MFDRDHKHTIRKYRIAAVIIALLATGAFAASAQAATFTVNTTTDNAATASECSGVAGDCSLRQAINKANASTPPTTIVVPAGAYSLFNGQLAITQSMTITGAGARTTNIFQDTSSPTSRVLEVQANAKTGFLPTVTISGVAMQDGHADSTNGFFGGNVLNQGNLTLSEDVITEGNTASGSGAGISNDGGTLTVTHSLVDFNGLAGGTNDSGGIQNFGPNPVTGTAGKLAVTDSTIYDNQSSQGGGIFSWCGGANGACSSSGATPTTTVTNSTIAGNDGGGFAGGGLRAADGGTISVQNSIVAANTFDSPATGTPSNCGTGGATVGKITSSGYNLDSGTDCGFASVGDIHNTDPKFVSGSPEDLGGNTDVIRIHANSPAVDAIPPGAPGCGGTDQADTPRPQGTGCDIGAYEAFQPVEGNQATFTVAPTTCGGASSNPDVVINWGDGTTTSGTTSSDSQLLIGTHAYAEEGIYNGTVSWNPGDCVRRTDPFDVKVQDAPLSAGPPHISAGAGQAFSGPVATFGDADPNGTASDYTATINWGDGTTSAGTVTGTGPFTVSGTHTYATGGSDPVSVSISDVGGASAAATGTATVVPETQPTLTPGTPIVTSNTSAAFATTVNPEGLMTQVYFQYGPALAAARDVGPVAGHAAAPITYTASTPANTIGPDYSNHTVTTSVAGLLPNTTYHVRAVATNSQGTAVGPDQTLTTGADPAPPPPVLGKSVDVAPVAGVVFIKLPNGKPLYASDRATGAASGLTKGTGFVPLTEARQLPSGTQIDARLGTIKLVAATPKRHKTQSGDFTGGLFGFAQDRHGINKGMTTLSLLEGIFPGAPSFASCKAKPAADASSPLAYAAGSSKVLQTLRASAHGRFRTRGRYAAATVRGTAWTTTDRCDGTLISVQRHTVAVTDLVRHVTLFVHQGHSYLARARRK